jgi:hypothetical protein
MTLANQKHSRRCASVTGVSLTGPNWPTARLMRRASTSSALPRRSASTSGVKSSTDMPHDSPHKQWWAPVWTGLVLDAEGQHYRRMKHAVWLYLYCLLSANRTTGLLTRRIRTVCDDMGVPRTTVIRWLDTLRAEGYVATSNSGHSLTIQVRHFKSLPGVPKAAHQKYQKWDFWNPKNGTSGFPPNSPFPAQNRPKTAVSASANKNDITITLNNTMQVNSIHDDARRRPLPGLGDSAHRELLAHEVATALHDEANVSRYREICGQYSERLIRCVLAEVDHMPAAHAPQGRSRSALFTYRIQQYVPRTPANPGH